MTIVEVVTCSPLPHFGIRKHRQINGSISHGAREDAIEPIDLRITMMSPQREIRNAIETRIPDDKFLVLVEPAIVPDAGAQIMTIDVDNA
jgi:hypothetical protein